MNGDQLALCHAAVKLAAGIDPDLSAERAGVRLDALCDALILGHAPRQTLMLIAATALTAVAALDRRTDATLPQLPLIGASR